MPTGYEWIWLVVLLAFVFAGFLGKKSEQRAERAGWLWFVESGASILVGSSPDEPGDSCLFKKWFDEVSLALRKAELALEDSCIRSNEYEREPTLAYIDHLKGEW